MSRTATEALNRRHDERGGNLVALDGAQQTRPLGAVATLPAVRVLIAERQALVRAGVRALLEAASHVSVVAEAATTDEAFDLARRTRAQVTLLDADLPGGDCGELTRRIRAKTDSAVLLLTGSEGDGRIFSALRAGATGLMLKDAEPADLVRAVRALAQGDVSVSPRLMRCVIAELASRPCPGSPTDGRLEELTAREREVMALVGLGFSNAEIAERLVVTRATAKTHVSRAMLKLRARDRAQLVAFAYESGLVMARSSG
jgi:DNA-binding NarL/FixJ family response regulator